MTEKRRDNPASWLFVVTSIFFLIMTERKEHPTDLSRVFGYISVILQ